MSKSHTKENNSFRAKFLPKTNSPSHHPARVITLSMVSWILFEECYELLVISIVIAELAILQYNKPFKQIVTFFDVCHFLSYKHYFRDMFMISSREGNKNNPMSYSL